MDTPKPNNSIIIFRSGNEGLEAVMSQRKATRKFIPKVYCEVVLKSMRSILISTYLNMTKYAINFGRKTLLVYFVGCVLAEIVISSKVREVWKPHGWKCIHTYNLTKGIYIF